MRYHNLIITILVLFLLSSNNAFCQTPQVEVISYDLKVRLNLPDNQLHVTASLNMKKADTLSQFEMLFTSDTEISSIKSKMSNDWIDMPHNFVGKDTLRLRVPSELVSSGELTIDFEYTLSIGEAKDDVMMWDRGHRWYPLIIDQIAKFQLATQVPHEYMVFSAGDLVEKKETAEYSEFVWQSQIPVFKIPLIIAKSDVYKETIEKLEDKKIHLYSFPIDDKRVIERIISESAIALRFYNDFIGEHHHDRLTLIEIPELQGTNIGTGLLMIGSNVMDAYTKGHYDNLHLSLASQWMAAGVFFKLFGKGFWFFQLSWPHYLRLMYLEQTKGEGAFTEGLQRGLDAYKQFAGTDKDVAILDINFPNTREKGSVIYGKGPYIIDKVRRQIGDENWKKLLKDIYRDFKGKILTYDEFVKYLSKYDPHKTCVSRLEKMLSETGLPEK